MASCFISHATEDRPFVMSEILGLLEAVGVDTWFDDTDIETAEDWQHSIREGLESSDWFAIVLSSNAERSQWVKTEVAWAMRHRPGRIIPIIIGDCDPEKCHLQLPEIQRIDFRKQPQKARQRLIKKFVAIQHNPYQRVKSIAGDWIGSINQDPGGIFPDGAKYPINAKLSIGKGDSIEGEFVVDLPLNDKIVADPPLDDKILTIAFSVNGGFKWQRFLHLNYATQEYDSVQFGSVIAELSADSRVMRGKFVGYGAQSEKIVTGCLTLERH